MPTNQLKDWEKEFDEMWEYYFSDAVLEHAYSEGYEKAQFYVQELRNTLEKFISELLTSQKEELKNKIAGMKRQSIDLKEIRKLANISGSEHLSLRDKTLDDVIKEIDK